MKPRSAKTHFLKRLAATNLSLDTLTPKAGIEAMLAYYVEERADGCDIDEDGDMLLFQWIASESKGESGIGIEIIRQLMATDDEDDEPRQLRLCFEFEQVPITDVGAGSQWCETPEGVKGFQAFIDRSVVYKAVSRKTPKSIELHFDRT